MPVHPYTGSEHQQAPALAHAGPCAGNAAIPPRPASVAVIDVETTGFSPRHGDRIVELAIVVIHAHGPVLREFATLLNPERDIGPTQIHGLTATDVRHAPRFSDIAGRITETLAGCTAIAGHNVSFDHRFLKAEFERLGHAFPEIPTLCTMRLAGGGKLACVCEEYGIPLAGQAHTALDDVRATARLLSLLLADAPLQVADILRLPPVTWPTIPLTPAAPICRSAARQRANEAPAYLQRLLSRVVPDAIADPDDTALFQYAALLARILEDRHVTESEGHALVDLASLPTPAAPSATFNPDHAAPCQRRSRRQAQRAGSNDCHGQSDQRKRRPWIVNDETQAPKAVADPTFSPSTHPHTQSGKAKRAREYGIRIVQERVFWQTLGLEVG